MNNFFSKIKIALFNFFVYFAFIEIIIIVIAQVWASQNPPNQGLIPKFSELILFILGLTSLFTLINSFITAKHFDNIWKETLLKNTSLTELYYIPRVPKKLYFVSRPLRGIFYASHIFFENNSKKNPLSNMLFDGYDFRNNARLIDKIISFTIIYLLLGFLGLLVLAFLIKLFIYFF